MSPARPTGPAVGQECDAQIAAVNLCRRPVKLGDGARHGAAQAHGQQQRDHLQQGEENRDRNQEVADNPPDLYGV